MTRYYIRLPKPEAARGDIPELSFTAAGGDAFAEQLQDALRTDALFQRWRGMQDDPDAVDPALGQIDPQATVTGQQSHLAIDLVVRTSLPGNLLKQRLRWLAGSNWELRDVTAG